MVSIIENEYGLLKKEDGLDSMSFGVPAKIGSRGVEAIIELPVDDIRDQIERSADFIKQDIQQAASILKNKFKID